MSPTPALSTWLDLLWVVALSTSLAIALAAAAARWFSAAIWQRTCWQVGVVALWLIVLAELSGGLGSFGSAITRFTSTSTPPFAPAGSHDGRAAIGGALPSIAELLGLYDSPFSAANGALRRDTYSDTFRDDEWHGNQQVDHLLDKNFQVRDAYAYDRITAERQIFSRDEVLHGKLDAPVFSKISDDPRGPDQKPFDQRPASMATGVATPVWAAWWPGWLWLMVSGILTVRMVFARTRLCLYCRRTGRDVDSALRDEVDRVARRLRAGRPRAVALPGVSSPVAFGMLLPTVGLPEDFVTQFDQQQRWAVLAHEIAHLRGCDPAWLLAGDLTAAALWWQPLVWWFRGRLRTASEAAADEASVAAGAAPEVLAECLVQMGRRLACPAKLAWLGFADVRFRSGLGRRVCRLLQHNSQPPLPAGRIQLAGAFLFGPAVLLAGVLICTAWARPQAPLTQGDSTMTSLRNTWRQSLTAAALAAFLAGSDAVADEQAATSPDADAILLSLLDEDAGAEARRRAAREEDEEREHAERRERAEREEIQRREAEEREFAEHVERIQQEIRELLEADREDAAEELRARLREMLNARRQRHEERRRDHEHAHAEELEARAEEIEREIHRRLEAGNEEEAEELRAQLHRLIQRHEQITRQRRYEADMELARRQLEEHTHDLRRQIEEHLREGREDAAHEVERHLREIISRHERQAAEHQRREEEGARRDNQRAQLEDRLEHARHRIRELLEDGNEEAARELEREAREIERELRTDRAGEDGRRRSTDETQRRLEHLHEAARILIDGGYEEFAERLHHEMEELERFRRENLDGERREARPDRPRRAEGDRAPVSQLREEVQQLRREIDQLRRMLTELGGHRDAERERPRGADRDRPRRAERERDRERDENRAGEPDRERDADREPEQDRDRERDRDPKHENDR